MHIRLLLGGTLLMALLSSCSTGLTPFTQDLYEKQGWTQSELKKIQFYLSDDVILRREMTRGESNITRGKIYLEDGRRIEQIVLPSGTPGVLLFMPRENRFAVSFEKQDNDLYLMFGPNPKMKNQYALLAKEWARDHGKVHYNGNLYEIDGRSGFATLLVDLKRTGSTQYSSRRAEGRTVE